MIVFLEGVVRELGDDWVVLNVNGVGYAVAVTQSVRRSLSLDESIQLHIYPIYREDTRALYGFLEHSDKEFFRLLVEKVSGIGPKSAVALLNNFTTEELYGIILSSDLGTLSGCPGVGKKTAQRILVELKDLLSKKGRRATSKSLENRTAGIYRETVEALLALGYSHKRAEQAVDEVFASCPALQSTEHALKMVLSALSKKT
jgi:Holliday junction DNA helicase RuvA